LIRRPWNPSAVRALAGLFTIGGLTNDAAAESKRPLPVQRAVGEGTVDWTRGQVDAQGVSSPRRISPHTDWIEGDLRAESDARSLRNLRETLAAITYDSDRTVADVLTPADLEALAERAEESARETLSDGTAIRRVRLPLDLLREAVGAKLADSPADSVVLVIEARGVQLTPAFRMRILDASETALWTGVARYVSQRPRELRKAPLLKVKQTSGRLGTDVVLDAASHARAPAFDKLIGEVWVVVESWVRP
jgi:hypothetical protein